MSFPPRVWVEFAYENTGLFVSKGGKKLLPFDCGSTATGKATHLSIAEHEATVSKLKEILLMVVSRDSTDPEHNWLTCGEPSCILAREALREVNKETK